MKRRRRLLILLVALLVPLLVCDVWFFSATAPRNPKDAALIGALLRDAPADALRALQSGANPNAVVTYDNAATRGQRFGDILNRWLGRRTQRPIIAPRPALLLALNQSLFGPDPVARDLTVALVKTLLDRGADTYITTESGTTLLLYAVDNDFPQAVALLAARGANVNAMFPGYPGTPLLTALERGNLDMVNTLLDAGANPNLASAQGYTPLEIAVKAGRVTPLLALLNHGANLSARSADGRTALLWAMNHQPIQGIQLLLDAGVALSRCDNAGNSALNLAWAANRFDVAPLLMMLGAQFGPTTKPQPGVALTLPNGPIDHNYGMISVRETAIRSSPPLFVSNDPESWNVFPPGPGVLAAHTMQGNATLKHRVCIWHMNTTDHFNALALTLENRHQSRSNVVVTGIKATFGVTASDGTELGRNLAADLLTNRLPPYATQPRVLPPGSIQTLFTMDCPSYTVDEAQIEIEFAKPSDAAEYVLRVVYGPPFTDWTALTGKAVALGGNGHIPSPRGSWPYSETWKTAEYNLPHLHPGSPSFAESRNCLLDSHQFLDSQSNAESVESGRYAANNISPYGVIQHVTLIVRNPAAAPPRAFWFGITARGGDQTSGVVVYEGHLIRIADLLTHQCGVLESTRDDAPLRPGETRKYRFTFSLPGYSMSPCGLNVHAEDVPAH